MSSSQCNSFPFNAVYKPASSISLSRDFAGALRRKEPKLKPGRGLYSRAPSFRFEDKVVFFHGKKIPISAIRGAHFMDEYKIASRYTGDLFDRWENLRVVQRETPPIITALRDNLRKDYIRFVRNLPNDELEYLALHYHDRWMWETDSASDKESFEVLLEERDLRKNQGWIVERPLLSQAKKLEVGHVVEEKERLQIMLILEFLPQRPRQNPLNPSLTGPHELIVDVLSMFGVDNKPYLIEYLDGYLRRR